MKKTISFILCLIIIAAVLPKNINANNYVRVNETTEATVVEVIDGHSIRVRVNTTGELALVRLIGVNSNGFNGGIDYLNNTILGQNVTLVPDQNLSPIDGRWNLLYVYRGDTLINRELLNRGYGRLNTSHSAATMYSSLHSNQLIGRDNGLGMWRDDDNPVVIFANGINMNTATQAQMESILYGVDSNLANQIELHRINNPFNSARDIRFVDGMTYDIFEANRHLMSVSTNINTATEQELLTLRSFNQSQVDRIIAQRRQNQFTSTKQLYEMSIISLQEYNRNKDFISVENRNTIEVSNPIEVVNINTATHTQIMDAGATRQQALQIMDNRGTYSYKTLEELIEFTSSQFTRQDINALEDNFNIRTNINTATENELRSIFTNTETRRIIENRPFRNINDIEYYVSEESFERARDHIYVGTYNSIHVNINTASVNQLRDIGLSLEDATTIHYHNRSINQYSHIPVDISQVNSRVSLFTNINTADIIELESLGIPPHIISEIVGRRARQPFTTLREVEEIFIQHSEISYFRDIRNYIVFR
jgi:DNA uptake protein ComE-like DNA-binding protein/endonuclease YncB( thermonuclease family)